MKELRVEIYGQSYAVGGEVDPAYVEKLARTVDATMRALAAHSDTLGACRLAARVRRPRGGVRASTRIGARGRVGPLGNRHAKLFGIVPAPFSRLIFA